METRMEFVTPGQAKAWLDKYNPKGNNRKFRPEWCTVLASYIINGQWQESHQGIAFGRDGMLQDGQHRLAAIVEANIGINIQVSRGVPIEARPYIDTSRPRTDADAMVIEGLNASAKSVAVARCMYEAGHGFKFHGSRRMPRPQLIEYHTKHATAIDFAMGLNARKASGSPIGASIARAYYSQDRDRLSDFIRVMNNGQPDDPDGDVAAILLRNVCITSIKKFTREQEYYRAQTALQHFLDRNKIIKLQTQNYEHFPLPGEK